MKLGIFTDSHYCSAESTWEGRYNNKSLTKIKQAMKHFAEEKCDVAICLGDLTDFEDTHEEEVVRLKEISDVINSYDMKKVILQGNHDAFAFSVEEFYDVLGEECKPKTICCDNTALVFLDACYFKSGVRYMPGDSDWRDTYYPFEEELEELLNGLPENVYVFLHQVLDPEICEDHRLFNAERIRIILEKNGNVRGVFQGHYHPGKKNVINGIEYVTLPAMCEKENAYYVMKTGGKN